MRHYHGRLLALALPLAFAATAARADVAISSAATSNMSCTAGVCAPTATDAVLNAGDLEALLASGNVEVTTTGSGVQADSIDVTAKLSWSNSTVLALDAYESIAVTKKVAVKGQGGLVLATNDGGNGGTLSFGATGSFSFANLSSQLAVNGAAYTLVKTIATLASEIAANPAGDYALAENFDASGDGTYSNSPITSAFTGTFDGLGNTISNISVDVQGTGDCVGGLFSELGTTGTVENLGLETISMSSRKRSAEAGLVCINYGVLFGDHVGGGVLLFKEGEVGGLVGRNTGTVDNSYSTMTLRAGKGNAGGLVAGNDEGGTITNSYATGSVNGETNAIIGGLVGSDGGGAGTIDNSYATGSLRGGLGSTVGGLVGTADNVFSINDSYSTGEVKGANGSEVGGFLGSTNNDGSNTDCYWDTTTSRTDTGVGSGSASGVTGLTTKQFRAGLPQGFDPTIWAEKKGINGGLPYLIANPPVK